MSSFSEFRLLHPLKNKIKAVIPIKRVELKKVTISISEGVISAGNHMKFTSKGKRVFKDK